MLLLSASLVSMPEIHTIELHNFYEFKNYINQLTTLNALNLYPTVLINNIFEMWQQADYIGNTASLDVYVQDRNIVQKIKQLINYGYEIIITDYTSQNNEKIFTEYSLYKKIISEIYDISK